MAQRKCILFFAEAVTLAHITRPLVLAQSLDPEQYEVHFASSTEFDFVFPEQSTITKHVINSIPSSQFIKALSTGARLYDKKTLAGYIDEDIALIEYLKPDIVVGDFRLSLAVSATKCHVPYIALTNAHWSPYSSKKDYPLPTHFMTKYLGLRVTDFFFQAIRPIIFNYHARPHNQLRVDYNLEPIGGLSQVYTYGDYTMYLDVPELIPMTPLPKNHYFIGPLIWSPSIPLPTWFNKLKGSKQTVYVTLGSSGVASALPAIVSVLSQLDVNIVVSTAGRFNLSMAENIYVEDYLPAIEIIKKCDLVVCNGGSATAYQALSEGVPVLGIASNMDQYLTMSYIEIEKVGKLLRSEQASNVTLLKKVAEELLVGGYKSKAEEMGRIFKGLNCCKQFNKIIEQL